MLPASARRRIHDGWYTGIRRGDGDEVAVWWMDIEIVKGYQTDQPQHELYAQLSSWLGPLAKPERERARETHGCSSEEARRALAGADRALDALRQARGNALSFLPDVSFVRVRMDDVCPADLAYTLISDKSYQNVSSMFSEQEPGAARDASGDRLTVVPWLEGSYPELFLVVPSGQVEAFAEQYAAVKTEQDYERLLDRFGVRRTSASFWDTSDWFNAQALREQPERAGIFDLNRYQNR